MELSKVSHHHFRNTDYFTRLASQDPRRMYRLAHICITLLSVPFLSRRNSTSAFYFVRSCLLPLIFSLSSTNNNTLLHASKPAHTPRYTIFNCHTNVLFFVFIYDVGSLFSVFRCCRGAHFCPHNTTHHGDCL